MKHDETETKSSELLTSTRASTVQPFASGFAKEMSQRYNKLSQMETMKNSKLKQVLKIAKASKASKAPTYQKNTLNMGKG